MNRNAGPSITAVGLILAGTFAVLALAQVSFLQQFGFSVAAGILLSAFVMSMFLVPSLAALIGHTAWRGPWGRHVNRQPVIFGFVLLAATLNVGFFVGDLSDPREHNVYQLFAAVLVSFVVTALKFRDRTQLGAVHLATSLVADLQLVAATVCWAYAAHVSSAGLTSVATATIVSLSGGALFANLASVTMLVTETVSIRQQ